MSFGESDPGGLTVFLSNGPSTFRQGFVSIIGGAVAVAAGDLYSTTPTLNEATIDLAITDFVSNQVILFRNDGGGGFSKSQTIHVGIDPVAVEFLSADGDGRLDIAVAQAGESSVAIFYNDETASFEHSDTISLPVDSRNEDLDFVGLSNHLTSLAKADWNGDGREDLAIGRMNPSAIDIYFGTEEGFGTRETIPTAFPPRGISALHYDDDERWDLVASNGGFPSVSLLLNDGSTLGLPDIVPTAGHGHALVVGDFDGDGRQDFVATNIVGSEPPGSELHPAGISITVTRPDFYELTLPFSSQVIDFHFGNREIDEPTL